MYRGHVRISSSCVPRPTILPPSRTRILSASITVPILWATIITVLPSVSDLRASLSFLSVAKSRAENESSKM